MNTAFARFKELADRKSEIFDEDIMAIVSEESAEAQEKEHFRFVSLSQHSETGEQPQARVVFSVDGKEVTGEVARQRPGRRDAARDRNGRWAAARNCVLYSVNAITTGTQAQGEVTVRLSKSGPHRQRRGHRSGYRRGLGEGVYRGAEQAALERRTS